MGVREYRPSREAIDRARRNALGPSVSNLKIVEFKIDEVRFLPYNPNRLPAPRLESLASSHAQFGILQPIVVNDRKGDGWKEEELGLYVVGGEHRLRVARKLGMSDYPGILVSVPRAEEQVMNLALNNAGDYDQVALGSILKELRAMEANLSATGLDQADVDLAIRELERDLSGEEDIVPPMPLKAKTAAGEILKLGRHRLLCGDAMEAGTLATLTEGQKAQTFVTDPPYAIYGSASGLSADITDDKIVRPFFENVLRMAKEHTRKAAHAYVFCDWRSWASWWEMAKRVRMMALNLLVWDKGGSGLGSNYANTYELIGFFANVHLSGVMTQGQKKGTTPVLKPNITPVPSRPLEGAQAQRGEARRASPGVDRQQHEGGRPGPRSVPRLRLDAHRLRAQRQDLPSDGD